MGKASLIFFVCHLLHITLFWPEIPDRIAIHFTGDQPDGWGPKAMLFLAPAIGMIIWYGMKVVANYPGNFNYINLTEENKDRQKKAAQSMIHLLKNVFLLAFLAGNEALLMSAIGEDPIFFFTLTILLLLFPLPLLIGYMIWAVRLKS